MEKFNESIKTDRDGKRKLGEFKEMKTAQNIRFGSFLLVVLCSVLFVFLLGPIILYALFLTSYGVSFFDLFREPFIAIVAIGIFLLTGFSFIQIVRPGNKMTSGEWIKTVLGLILLLSIFIYVY